MISAVHPALPAWRQIGAMRSVGSWAGPDGSMAGRDIGVLGVLRPNLLAAWGTGCFATGGMGWTGVNASLPGAGRCPKHGVREKVAGRSQPRSIMHLPPALTSSATTVGGVCTYVKVSVAC